VAAYGRILMKWGAATGVATPGQHRLLSDCA
jgi:hypothetical protein